MAPSSLAPSGFPTGFSWGTASSATQCQGATSADNWWAWEQAGKAPRSGDGNGFDKLYESDFALLADWGFSDHRLSLDWARIEPQPGRHNQEAVEHYRHILQTGRDAGLTMWVCLLHTALPTWFASEGGFLSPGATATWARHVDFIAETFGDLADGWMPVNNPTAYAQKAYLTGTFPPGHTSQEEFLTVLQAIHQADFEAALRLRQGGTPTSTNEALLPLHPADDSADAAAATALVDAVVWGSWLNLARTPRYEDAFDQYGFSYYFTPTVGPSGDLFPYPAGEPVGPQGYVSWAPITTMPPSACSMGSIRLPPFTHRSSSSYRTYRTQIISREKSFGYACRVEFSMEVVIMWTYEYSVTANCTPQDVWACYADPSVWPEWDAEIKELTLEGPFAAGVAGTMSLHHLPPMALTVTVVLPHAEFRTETRMPDGTLIRFVYLLAAPDGSGTRITHRVEIEGPAAGTEFGDSVAAPVPDTLRKLARVADARARRA